MVSAAETVRAQQTGRSGRPGFWAHLVLVVIATASVTVVPILGVRAFEAVSGIHSLPLSVVVGTLLSLVITTAGSRLWSSMAASEDILFGELMVWGWLRRARSDARLARATERMGLDGRGWAPDSSLSPTEQTALLRDLATSLEKRDAYTHGHSNRVTRYSHAIARTMGLDPATVENIRVSASLHDIGKVRVPLEILRKTGPLTDEEFEQMKEHAALSAEMVSILGNDEITAMVRHHHERLDGRGYPDRLAGTDIPLGARIIAVADTFDAICSTRPYQKAANHKKALAILKKEAGTHLDGDAIDAFVSYYSGRGSFEWRAMVTTIPQRLVEFVTRSVPTGLVQGATATVIAVIAIQAPTIDLPAVLDSRRASAMHSSSERRAVGASDSVAASADASEGTGNNRDVEGFPTVQSTTGSVDPGPQTTPADDDASPGDPDPAESKEGTSADAPGAGTTDPTGGATDPTGGVTDPVGGATDPTGGVTDPVGGVTDPVTDPIGGVTDPVTGPIGGVTDPVTGPIGGVTDPVTGPIGGGGPLGL